MIKLLTNIAFYSISVAFLPEKIVSQAHKNPHLTE